MMIELLCVSSTYVPGYFLAAILYFKVFSRKYECFSKILLLSSKWILKLLELATTCAKNKIVLKIFDTNNN